DDEEVPHHVWPSDSVTQSEVTVADDRRIRGHAHENRVRWVDWPYRRDLEGWLHNRRLGNGDGRPERDQTENLPHMPMLSPIKADKKELSPAMRASLALSSMRA